MEQQQKKQAEALGREIVASASRCSAVEVKLEAGQAALLSTVSEQYAAKTETAALERTLRSALEQTAEHLTLRFDEANAYTLEVDGKLAQLIGQLQTYIRFGTEGIELGELGSPFTSLLGNEKLSFMQSGVEIAYISNHKMYITRAQVADSLTVAARRAAIMIFRPNSNGSFFAGAPQWGSRSLKRRFRRRQRESHEKGGRKRSLLHEKRQPHTAFPQAKTTGHKARKAQQEKQIG